MKPQEKSTTVGIQHPEYDPVALDGRRLIKQRGTENMDANHNIWTCTECGYTSSEKFPNDICPRCSLTYWRCAECSYTLVAAAAPEICPECQKKCCFVNITCYIPDWEIIEPSPWRDRYQILSEV